MQGIVVSMLYVKRKQTLNIFSVIVIDTWNMDHGETREMNCAVNRIYLESSYKLRKLSSDSLFVLLMSYDSGVEI